MSFWTPKRTAPSSPIFELEVTLPVSAGEIGKEFLMGGIGMAAAILAAEAFTGKPIIWATIQFIAPGPLGSLVTLEAEELSRSRNLSQVRVSLSVGDQLIQQIIGACGGREKFEEHQFIKAPKVPPPDECPIRFDVPPSGAAGLPSHFERRRAYKCNESGLEYMWTRPKFDTNASADMLAITSDFILGANQLSNGSLSIDNTLRIFSVKPTDWILCVTQMAGVKNGITHGTMYQFSQDDTLLAISSQTGWLPRK